MRRSPPSRPAGPPRCEPISSRSSAAEPSTAQRSPKPSAHLKGPGDTAGPSRSPSRTTLSSPTAAATRRQLTPGGIAPAGDAPLGRESGLAARGSSPSPIGAAGYSSSGACIRRSASAGVLGWCDGRGRSQRCCRGHRLRWRRDRSRPTRAELRPDGTILGARSCLHPAPQPRVRAKARCGGTQSWLTRFAVEAQVVPEQGAPCRGRRVGGGRVAIGS